jgi:hypothetical protein
MEDVAGKEDDLEGVRSLDVILDVNSAKYCSKSGPDQREVMELTSTAKRVVKVAEEEGGRAILPVA